MSIRRGLDLFFAQHGQSALEMVLLITAVVLAVVGLSNYLRNAAAARIKSGAESLSPVLADPEQMAGASIRCQQSMEQQNAKGGPGRVKTAFAEAMQERTGDPAQVKSLVNCPPLPQQPAL